MKLKAGDHVGVYDRYDGKGKLMWTGVVAERPGKEWVRVRADISGEVRNILQSRVQPIAPG